MNTALRMERITVFVCLALALSGCQTVSSTHVEGVGCPQLAATAADRVQILPSAPTRSHMQVGAVRVEHRSRKIDSSTIEAALRDEAARLGADAVVVVDDHTQPLAPQCRVVVGIAIKYL